MLISFSVGRRGVSFLALGLLGTFLCIILLVDAAPVAVGMLAAAVTTLAGSLALGSHPAAPSLPDGGSF